MKRLVVVSNRVAPLDEGQVPSGGLAVAVHAALREKGGIWFGWNGDVTTASPEAPEMARVDNITYATIGLSRRDYLEYYIGFANATLWPLFHYRVDLAGFKRREYAGYNRVNQRFARYLWPLLRRSDTIWIHDYHLIPLAEELRRLGAGQPIGFFLHTPFPALQVLITLPCHSALVRALFSYDLIGFQTEDDLAAFRDYVIHEAGGSMGSDGRLHAFGRSVRAEAHPIGIDTANIVAMARRFDTHRVREEIASRHMIIGVDRLDYSKGLVQRFHSFERMLEQHPEAHRRMFFVQIAPPSRGSVQGYAEIRRELEEAAGHINGRFADFDWTPIRYLNKSFEREELAGFYRCAATGLVTPLRDGMNLVAKEYVAAQDERDPGVLVLSRFAGAARELTEALIVNPHDIDDMAGALGRALAMPIEERRRRWRAMMDRIEANDVDTWRNAFLGALDETAREIQTA
jgi:trehalose 6-phosphate synthase